MVGVRLWIHGIPDPEKDRSSTSMKHHAKQLKITQKGLDALRKDRDRRAAVPKVSISQQKVGRL